MVKDLENLTGDLTQDYNTVAVRYGTTFSKYCISLLLATVLPTYLLISTFNVGAMDVF